MVRIGVNTPLMKETIAEFGAYEAFRKVSEIGFKYYELSQYEMNKENVDALLAAQADFGIRVRSVSADVEPLEGLHFKRQNLVDDFDEIVETCRKLDCRHVRTFLIGGRTFADLGALREYADKFEAAAVKLASVGMDYSYHPHNFEYCKLDGKVALRHFRDMTKETKFELCTFWIQTGGLDSASLIREFGSTGRVTVAHLKDYRTAVMTPEIHKRMMENPGAGVLFSLIQFAEAGEGNLDIPGIIAACDEVGTEYIFLEQDQHYGRSELDILKTDWDNLCAMGFENRMRD